jgi:two-component system copper resistance phosphate regulon response regulator CusR
MGLSAALPEPSSLDAATRQHIDAQTHRVLVVEDDIPLSNFLCRELRLSGFSVHASHDGESACEHLESSRYDLVLLDLNLPRMDGISLLDRVRATQPRSSTMVLTARTSTEDRVRALDHGADDCLIKPFSFQELQARMRSMLRRRRVGTSVEPSDKVGELILNREEYRVVRGARRIELTPREFALLECLVTNIGKPVSRMVFLKEVWNIALETSSNIVDVYMKYLRDKIDIEGEPKLIRTVRGIGYELRTDG